MEISTSTFPSLSKQPFLSNFRLKATSQSLSRIPFTKPKPSFKALSLCRDDVARQRTTVIEAREKTHVISSSTMDDVYNDLAERLLPMARTASKTNSKYIVGIAGSPGAGKSTLAAQVADRINATRPLDPQDVATVVPMDGFHLYRSQLDAMENPEEAHARRGAPWTFDPERLLTCLQTLKNKGSAYMPSFNHGVGDPVEDDIFVGLEHSLVIVEGNYLLLDQGLWKEISSLFDEKWFINLDIDTAMQRVMKRHISTGKPPEIAKRRIEYNDRPNGELINDSKKNADLVIQSVDL